MERGQQKRKGRFGDYGWGGFDGYMSAKIQKLDQQFQGDASLNIQKMGTSSEIFKNVAIYVNGYTDPPAEKLKKLMMLHGGKYIHYPNKTNTTHIIATNLPYTKIKELKKEKVVTPDWITDSIKAGKLLSHVPYLLYKPKATNHSMFKFTDSNCNWTEGNSTKGASDDTPMLSSIKSHASSMNDSAVDFTSSASFSSYRSDTGNHCLVPSNTAARDLSARTQLTNSSSKSPPDSGISHSASSMQTPTQKHPGGTSKAGDPNFMEEFYNNSRLHHISMWGAEYKQYVRNLHKSGAKSFPGRIRLENLKRDGKLYSQISGGSNYDEDIFSGLSSNQNFRQGGGIASKRTIMHIDMDCFFVSVGLLSRPELRGKPVAVTHSRGRGMPEVNQKSREYEMAYFANKHGPTPSSAQSNSNVTQSVLESNSTSNGMPERPSEMFNSMAEIASCSYEARKAGVKNGMFMGPAKEKCPDLQTIPYDFDKYKEVSLVLYDTVASYTHDIEAVSCDEMFVDISEVLRTTGVSAEDFAKVLREEIYQKSGCNASAGVASSILLARLSTRVAKPNGQFHLEENDVREFMKKQKVRDLPGVGWAMEKKLTNLGISTCEDLQQASLGLLQKEFGQKTGQQLYQHCRGQDDRPIKIETERKSVSAEINYGIRFKQEQEAVEFIEKLCEEVQRRLTSIKMIGRTITLKLKVRRSDAPKETSKFLGHGICDDKARSMTLGQATDKVDIIKREVRGLLFMMKVAPEDMRGIGIQISRLQEAASTNTKSLKDFITAKTLIMTAQQNTASLPNTIPGSSITYSSSSTASTATTSSPSSVTTVTASNTAFTNGAIEKTSTSTSTVPAGRTKGVQVKMLSFVNKLSKDVMKGSSSPSPRKAPSLPPLPSLTSPPLRPSSRLSNIERKKGTDSSLFSPTQLDMSVLNSLPEEIRLQVIEEYNIAGRVPTKSRNIGSVNPNQPSTSKAVHPESIQSKLDEEVLLNLPPEILQEILDDETRKEEQLRKEREREKPVEELPSFSQVDPSCFDALPEEVKNELRTAYNQKYNTSKPPEPPSAPSNVAPSSSSSVKPSRFSPFKIHKRKGRPKKGSPTRPSKPSWQRGIFDAWNPQPGPDFKDEKKGAKDASSLPSEGREGVDVVPETQVTEKEKEPANLSGAVELWDVKELLREWISSYSNPMEQDIGILVQYLRDLILEKNLEMVHLVLRALRRIIVRCDSANWKTALTTVTERIQNTVEQIYGSRLKLPVIGDG